MSRKGEVSLEFVSLIGLILLIFVFMLTVIGIKNRDISDTMVYSDAQKIADAVAYEINTASIIEGYYRTFELPQKIAGIKDYSVTIYNESRFIEVRWESNSRMANIMTANVSGEVSPGSNKISNYEGRIRIES